jgi:AmmeMemoRadiSam system protein B/AmmeMemoRadiSam system protein A
MTRSKAALALTTLIFLSSVVWSQGIRKPVWAGQFYPKNPETLSQMMASFLQGAGEEGALPGTILALIAPHAGYVYSGHVAAHAYSLVKGQDCEAVVILAPSHRHGFKGCSIYLKGGYETPLGTAEVDEQLAAELAKASGFKYVPEAHTQEHAVEVQVPFIQNVLPQAKIVPVVMGIPSKKTIEQLAIALSKVLLDRKVLVIASTDLSHFLSKKSANALDAETISLIRSFNTDALIKKLERRENIMCGGGPVVSLLLYARSRKNAEIKILKYADSSAAGGSESQVVGYLSAAVVMPAASSQRNLSPEEKKELLRLARSAIELYVRENRVLEFSTQNPKFQAKKGVFVTLKKKGNLRGCVGFIESPLPLSRAVIETALYAACRDERFQPVSIHELDDLDIEISLLTPLEKIENPLSIQVGKHGLVVVQGDRKGLLLPQVPVEFNWSKKTFLKQACLKAGLPPDAWKSKADIYVFEADVFPQGEQGSSQQKSFQSRLSSSPEKCKASPNL